MAKSLLIVSSSKGLNYANALRNALKERFKERRFSIECEVWNDMGVFPGTASTLGGLMKKAESLSKENGYAVAMMTPDDAVSIENSGKAYWISRDNVLFEYGLFMGKLGRKHVFAVKPNGKAFWFLSDLSGITVAHYDYTADNPPIHEAQKKLLEASLKIAEWIAPLETEPSSTPESPPPSPEPESPSTPEIPPSFTPLPPYPLM